MGDGIDRSDWGPADYEAERQAQELVSMATGQPPPPLPPPPPPPPGGGDTLTALGFLRRIGHRIDPFGRGSRLWLSLLALFAVLLTISGAIWFTTRHGDDAAAGSDNPPVAAAEPGDVTPAEPSGGLEPGPTPGAGEAGEPVPGDEASPGGSAGEPAAVAEDPGGSTAQPGGDGGDLPAFADVVGVYRLVASSARDAMSPVVAEFSSAEGVLVIDGGGVVTGELTYHYADDLGQAGAGDLADVIFDGTLTAVRLDAAADGFTFTSTVEVVLDVTPRPPDEEGVATPAPFTTSLTMDVVGVVDLELGTVGLRQSGDQADSGTVIFQR